MYKTKKLLKWIDKEVIKYCEYLEIVPPVICYTKKDWEKVLITHWLTSPLITKEYVELYTKVSFPEVLNGAVEQQSFSILLFVNNDDNKTELEDTIVHELCHLRYNGVEHGEKFNSIIAKTIKECK